MPAEFVARRCGKESRILETGCSSPCRGVARALTDKEKTMKKNTSYLLLGGLSLLLSACVSPPVKPDASAELQARSGSRVSASARFTDTGEDKLRIEVTARNLTPGEHGIHLHELGDCSAPDASSARGHYNPLGKRHGHYDKPEHHVGDLPNLLADGKGNANYSTEVQGLL